MKKIAKFVIAICAAGFCITPAPVLADTYTEQQIEAEVQRRAAEKEAMNAAIAEEVAKQSQNNAPYDQNWQQNKRNFVKNEKMDKFYNSGSLQSNLSPYQLNMGTVIPGTLITGINSDLPGMVTAQVSQNVYDSVSGRYLLIPQGTRIIGTYDSQTTYAQTRALVVWQRLILPNGRNIALDNMQGIDQEGYSGLHDKVNSHFGRVIWSALIGGAMTAGVATATDVADSDSYRANAGADAADNISSAVDSVVQKNLNIQPTIIIRPGYEFNIFVSRDLILEPYQ